MSVWRWPSDPCSRGFWNYSVRALPSQEISGLFFLFPVPVGAIPSQDKWGGHFSCWLCHLCRLVGHTCGPGAKGVILVVHLLDSQIARSSRRPRDRAFCVSGPPSDRQAAVDHHVGLGGLGVEPPQRQTIQSFQEPSTSFTQRNFSWRGCLSTRGLDGLLHDPPGVVPNKRNPEARSELPPSSGRV